MKSRSKPPLPTQPGMSGAKVVVLPPDNPASELQRAITDRHNAEHGPGTPSFCDDPICRAAFRGGAAARW